LDQGRLKLSLESAKIARNYKLLAVRFKTLENSHILPNENVILMPLKLQFRKIKSFCFWLHLHWRFVVAKMPNAVALVRLVA